MKQGLLKLDDIIIDPSFDSPENIKSNVNYKDVAIVGISGRFGSAESTEELWDIISQGKDGIGAIPPNRKKDIDDYLSKKGVYEYDFLECAYLNQIDQFDYTRFSLSPKEAALVDPNQRLFVETAWAAIENAGYGGKRLHNSKTGVFVGFSNDFGEPYTNLIHVNDPESKGISVAGNVRSIIAARISYLLDLKGPSMVVDTACSSSLVAIHLACKSIQQGECDMALAGGVKTIIVPVRSKTKQDVGIMEVTGVESSSGRTKTFDDLADGTGMGEGVGVIVLKSLAKALEDGDPVYAVIKGSAINQDGSSVGITAPNADAQSEVLISAWKDAGIDPETIGYIEAHGTGTKLGDPVEIKGIQNAFAKYTTKKQFCGIGSIKTNIGHLDHAAGIAGIFKLILALQSKQIPPVLHFNMPNRNIGFVNSPVYVSDMLHPWKQAGFPRRCGISSFGLSGTNCHVVLEEAPSASDYLSNVEMPFLIPFSATTSEALVQNIKNYREYLTKNRNVDLSGLAFTNAVGRSHYDHRLVIISSTMDELLLNLDKALSFSPPNDQENFVFKGTVRVLFDKRKKKEPNALSPDELEEITYSANSLVQAHTKYSHDQLAIIAKLYVKGAEVDWASMFKHHKVSSLNLPSNFSNPFRCWTDSHSSVNHQERIVSQKSFKHPLVDSLVVSTDDVIVFESNLSVEKNWELREHKIKSQYLLPGTSYLEMVLEMIQLSGLAQEGQPVLQDVIFIHPLTAEIDESCRIHTVIKKEKSHWQFTISGRQGDVWQVHCQGKINFIEQVSSSLKVDMATLAAGLNNKLDFNLNDFEDREIEAGKRWHCANEIENSGDTYQVKLKLADEFLDDLTTYNFHPSLADCAVNSTNFSVGEGLFLPFSYKSLTVWDKLPVSFFSQLKVTGKTSETVTLDVKMVDDGGNVLVEIEGYMIKKVHKEGLRPKSDENNMYHTLQWKAMTPVFSKLQGKGMCLLLCDEPSLVEKINQILTTAGYDICVACTENINSQLPFHVVEPSEEGYVALLEKLGITKLEYVIHAYGNDYDKYMSANSLQHEKERKLISLFALVKTLVKHKITIHEKLIVHTSRAFAKGNENMPVHPIHTSLHAFVNVVSEEYPSIKFSSIDTDKGHEEHLFADLPSGKPILCRNNEFFEQYLEPFSLLPTANDEIKIKPDAAYIVTGGLGALGLEFAQYLARKGAKNLILLGRHATGHGHYTEHEDGDIKAIYRAKVLSQLTDQGVNVVIRQVDVADYMNLKGCIDSLSDNYAIRGVFHCAGVAGDGYVIQKSKEKFCSVLRPKMDGTLFLQELLSGQSLDFMVLFSSIGSFLNTPGQSDYSSANSFLNGFANMHHHQQTSIISVCWPAWEETGMAVDLDALKIQGIFKAIKTDVAIKNFDAVFRKNLPEIVIGQINTDFVKNNRIHLPFKWPDELQGDWMREKSLQTRVGADKKKLKAITLLSDDPDDINDTVVKTGNIWGNILGLDEIDILSNFYNLGGNSILATRLLKDYDSEFPGIVEIADIFTYTTILDMAAYINKKINKETLAAPIKEKDNLDDILEKLAKGELDPNDVNL